MGSNHGSCTSVILRKPINKSAILRRIPVALILIYYIWILIFAWLMQGSWWWRPEEGLWWSSKGPGQFFPIPKSPGWLMQLTPGYFHDHVFYLLFMHSGIWIIWLSLGFLFLSPYRINFHILYISIRTKIGFIRIS